jgi:hypothetical protein
MLSAGKQQMPSDVPPSSPAPAANTFGKVLTSVQGLQQRLDDFSVDEVSRAHTEACALIQRLDELQHQLTALAKLKAAVSAVNTRVAAIPDENIDLIAQAGLENHSQLQAVIQLGRVIQMRRSLRDAQAITNPSHDVQHQRFPALEQMNKEAVAPSTSPVELDPELAVENLTKPIVRASHATMGHNETKLGAGALRLPTTPGSDASSSTTQAVSHTAGDEIRATSTQPTDTRRTAEGANSTVNSAFDRRLLNDLIETYGEFAIGVTSSKSVDSSTMIPPEPLQDVPVPVKLMSVETERSEPAFVRPTEAKLLALPEPEKEYAGRARPVSPKLKKQGEIDQQLKNIIKDYGEYDLYSPQKSLNLKMAALAALALLALVLGGLYFFTGSPPAPPAAFENNQPAGLKEPLRSVR